MDIAFDNPEADRAVLGTDLTPSLLLAEAGLGEISNQAKNLNMLKYGINTGPAPTLALGTGGVALGGIGGALLGRKMGGLKGGIAGGLLGTIMGGAIGSGIGMAPTLQYASQNKQLLSQSPNSSLNVASQLNASGDIVLGMHNSRRG